MDTAQGKRHHSASPFHFAEVVTELPAAMPERADLLRGACSLVRDSYNVEAAIGAAHRIIGLADADDLPLIAETLTDLALSQEYTQSVQNRIGVASIVMGSMRRSCRWNLRPNRQRYADMYAWLRVSWLGGGFSPS